MISVEAIENTLMSLGYKTETDCKIDEDRVYRIDASTDTIICLVIAPHEGTNYKYMLRLSTRAAFDRWANSTPIEKFFDTEKEVVDYLKNNQLEIYKQLLVYLSEEYSELEQ